MVLVLGYGPSKDGGKSILMALKERRPPNIGPEIHDIKTVHFQRFIQDSNIWIQRRSTRQHKLCLPFNCLFESIGYMPHLKILKVITKTRQDGCAWKWARFTLSGKVSQMHTRALYEGGNLVPLKKGQSSDPKPTAGNDGTTLTVSVSIYTLDYCLIDTLHR